TPQCTEYLAWPLCYADDTCRSAVLRVAVAGGCPGACGPRIDASCAAFGPRPPFHRGRLARLAGGAGVVWLLRAADAQSPADPHPLAAVACAPGTAGTADPGAPPAPDPASGPAACPAPLSRLPRLTHLSLRQQAVTVHSEVEECHEPSSVWPVGARAPVRRRIPASLPPASAGPACC